MSMFIAGMLAGAAATLAVLLVILIWPERSTAQVDLAQIDLED